ncbi:Uncharacterised protein [Enterobacter cloacae]|nr:Uncharacterised protein [Enterobacter cloacae]
MCMMFLTGMTRSLPFSVYLYSSAPVTRRLTTMFCGSKGTSETRRFAMNFFSMKAFPRRQILATTINIKRDGVISELGRRHSIE